MQVQAYHRRSKVHQGDMVKFRQYINLLRKMDPPLNRQNKQPLVGAMLSDYEGSKAYELRKIWKTVKILDGEMYWIGPIVDWPKRS
jgi:hypothetical protein